MPLEWPEITEGYCCNFTVLALFGGAPPNAVRLERRATSTGENSSPTMAAGPEADTFVKVQPLFHQDNQLALLLQLTRKAYFDGNEPKNPFALGDVERRAETFLGKRCTTQIAGEYFLLKKDVPQALAAAVGPFDHKYKFLTVTGTTKVSNSTVKQIAWVLRDDGIWKFTLTGGRAGELTPQTVRDALDEFNSVFEAFCNPL